MFVRILNFGPVSDFEFDVKKNLIMIVGKNNIGKSYALTLLYLILKRMGDLRSPSSEFFDFDKSFSSIYLWGANVDLSKDSESFRSVFKKNIDSTAGIDITDTVRKNVIKFLSGTFAQNLTAALKGTYIDIAGLSNRYSKKHPQVIIRDDHFELILEVKKSEFIVSSFEFVGRKVLLKASAQDRTPRLLANGDRVLYYTPQHDSALEKNYNNLFFEIAYSIPLSLSKHVSRVHYLPASRSGLYQALSAFGAIIAELSKSRSFISRKIELPGISEPLSDYFIKLSESGIRHRNSHSKYEIYAKKIEDEVLNGTIEVDATSKRLIYLPKGTDLKLDLSSTSSMASEIGPIVTYLRSILTDGERQRGKAGPRQIIFIEEPEAHLHPEVQIKLIEIIAELSKETSTKIIFTSHSNYIFNKVSNMIIEKKIELPTFTACLFAMSDAGTTSIELSTDEYGIDDENFADASEQLYMERVALLDLDNVKDTESPLKSE